MFVLGLTGSIAMGKTWAAGCFRLLGVPVHDADLCVHQLMGVGGAVCHEIETIFPGVLDTQGAVDRVRLAERVFSGDGQEIKILEAILHPLVRAQQRIFLAQNARRHARLVVLDEPLLYETGDNMWVDKVAVVSAPTWLQKRRALKRPMMTPLRLKAILMRQIPDGTKRRAADYVISTRTRDGGLRQISAIVKKTKPQTGRVWTPGWGHASRPSAYILRR